MNMKNKFGTIAWQNEMLENINKKENNGIKIESYEEAFIQTQAEHNHRILEGELY